MLDGSSAGNRLDEKVAKRESDARLPSLSTSRRRPAPPAPDQTRFQPVRRFGRGRTTPADSANSRRRHGIRTQPRLRLNRQQLPCAKMDRWTNRHDGPSRADQMNPSSKSAKSFRSKKALSASFVRATFVPIRRAKFITSWSYGLMKLRAEHIE